MDLGFLNPFASKREKQEQPGSDAGNYSPRQDQFMGGGIPTPDFYGIPKPHWNVEMMDRLIDTKIDPGKDKNGKPRPKPKLWLFQTSAFRHFQLSNLRSRDQTEIERDIAEVMMLTGQDGNDALCEELQVRIYAKLNMYKSRCDLPSPHRERDAWYTNVTELKHEEIKRPVSNSSSFFEEWGNNRRRNY
jgi:hypothetical protein